MEKGPPGAGKVDTELCATCERISECRLQWVFYPTGAVLVWLCMKCETIIQKEKKKNHDKEQV